MAHWDSIEADLHEVYGFDTGAPGALEDRSWRWLQVRILGLLQIPPTVIPLTDVRVPATRLGRALHKPDQAGR